MRRFRPRSPRRRALDIAGVLIVVGAVGMVLSLLLVKETVGRSLIGVAGCAVLVAIGVGRWWERRRWADPVRALARNLAAFNERPDEPWELSGNPAIAAMIPPIQELQGRYLALRAKLDDGSDDVLGDSGSDEMDLMGSPNGRMTRSGSYEAPYVESAGLGSGETPIVEMISRLDPRSFRWLESTPAEQDFLGWSISELRSRSLLEIVQEDDRRLAKQELRGVLARGEGHGLVYRITTARGETRAVELNIGVRYGSDGRVLHLRCHLTDVTAKLRDESELRRRTMELTHANDHLRRANRELEMLKDLYSDLYENAPAMYFTVDRLGQFLECNNTLIRSLDYSRRDLIGRPVSRLLPESRTPTQIYCFAEVNQAGPLEFESEWARSSGEVVAVWVTGTAISGTDGKIRHIRCVAQDITARRKLEAELRVKNERLALANTELSRKNHELDEFTHVVSHDLQEPLRTLIAFSDFLLRDYGDQLDDTGKDYVRHLIEASRRLRALIRDLLSLSRAGQMAAEFHRVNLGEVVAVLKADLSGLVRSKGAEIRVESPLPAVWGDRDRIGRLLANLVGNGLKYNQAPNPRVEISAREDAEKHLVTLSIKDNGIGIAPQFHTRIFQLFRRLHTREEYEGTGAGLTICQKIVQAHGGKIWLESEPGRGSTFHVTLPSPAEGTGVK